MRTLYLELGMGIAGDMFSAALYELLEEHRQKEYLEIMNGLGPDGVRVEAETVRNAGVKGTHIYVRRQDRTFREDGHPADREHGYDAEAAHPHRGMKEIRRMVAGFALSEGLKQNILAVYDRIAAAEASVHGEPVEEIRFHELGSMEAIINVTSACLLVEMLSVDRIIASPVRVGYGSVQTAHGLLPVPAPATARLLEGIPIYAGRVEGELCTPTGAALVRHFVRDFGVMPPMRLSGTGYGMGGKQFTSLNAVRAFLGETDERSAGICELDCNLDDMTPERIGFAMDRLYEAGAVEVYTSPAFMKKSRPGILLVALCQEDRKQAVIEAIFRHTTTLGVRESVKRRYILDREIETVQTDLGPVRRKKAFGYGVRRAKYEYDDLAKIAREEACSMEEVLARIER